MPNLPYETADETIALDWAQELTAAFGRMHGEPCPFEVEASGHNGEPALRIAGRLVTLEHRSETPERVASYVASKLAGFAGPEQGYWHESSREVTAFIAHKFDDYHGAEQREAFEGWLHEFGGEPWKWTLEYIAYRSLCG